MKNNRYAILVAEVVFIALATLGSLYRSSQPVTQPQQYILFVWRRDS